MPAPPPIVLAMLAGALTFLIRLPFLFRYDLNFGRDEATSYLMALRISYGDRPLYLYGYDYTGAAEAYAAAALFKLFGASIPLSSVVTLVEWSIAAAIGVYLLTVATNRFVGTIGGLIVSVGAPYTLHYVTVPHWGYPVVVLVAMALLLEAFLIIDRGASIRRVFVLGLTAGFGWYVNKLCLPAIVAVLAAFVIHRTWPRAQAVAAGAFGLVLGYLPELVYRFGRTHYQEYGGFADFPTLVQNARFTLAAIPAYFDGQEISRIAEGTYFFSSPPLARIAPASFADWGVSIAGAAAIALAFRAVWRREHAALTLLATLVIVNLLVTISSAESHGLFLYTRRYLFPSAIAFSLWGGVLLSLGLRHRWRSVKIGSAVIGILFVARVIAHNVALLGQPDDLRDMRQIVAELNAAGISRAVGFGHAHEITALTNEAIVVSELASDERIPEYRQIVASADRLAVIDLVRDPVKPSLSLNGRIYLRSGPSRDLERLRWAVYERRE